MTEKYKNKYRIQSARLKNWDYGSNAKYFVTICTNDRAHYFGDIIDKTMKLSDIGNMAQKYWNEIPNHFPFVILDAFVAMPNHVHGIIAINKNDDHPRRDAINRVPTPTAMPTPSPTTTKSGGVTGDKNPMLYENLSRIIRWYKGRVSFESHKIDADFAWQSRFYDHIIRNHRSYNTISAYIVNNPLKWGDDKFHRSNTELY